LLPLKFTTPMVVDMVMMAQARREFAVSSTLGKDVLLFNRMTATEALSGLFAIDLALLSPDPAIDAKAILGTPVCVRVDLPAGGRRYFHGLCTDFHYTGDFGELFGYRAVLRPWLWVLTRSADCRIFQKQTTPEIIKQVFADHGFSGDVKELLSRSYEPWEYCVQYRETAFNFVSRLMEHEGIYYYFEHESDKHTLVLVDSTSAHTNAGGYAEVPYYPPTQTGRRKRDSISDWKMSWEIQSGTTTHSDYDFKNPALDLLAQTQGPAGHDHDGQEIYDYPGIYTGTDLGGSLSTIRLDELRARYQVARGHGDARGLRTGSIFSLTGHPRRDQNGEYLITSTTCHAVSNSYSGGAGAGEHEFTCDFTAISSKTQFRPPRVTPKPVVNGPQTAVVVGPAGEEIHTDPYGRIMVQFHWDRRGQKDENSSCWIRVGQLWASGSWGSIWVPRIGMEVIVEFLEGDPDRPIVTGNVYNGANKTPYSLPADKTKSTIKTNSSKGGGGSNEIRFEDKKGSEEMYVHAQKDMNHVVENDHSVQIGNDHSLQVGNDQGIVIQGGNRTIAVQSGTHTETIKGDTTIRVTSGKLVHRVEANTAAYFVSGDITENYNARQTTVVKDDIAITSGTANIVVDAALSIRLTSGASQITLQKDGTITITGKTVRIHGSDSVVIGGDAITITGNNTAAIGVGNQNTVYDTSKVATSGAGIASNAVGEHDITGAIVKIN
jgi:type VI secretion system secreted protein VgrG